MTFIFGDDFKEQLDMAMIINEKTVRAVRTVSTTDCTHFFLAVNFVLDNVLNMTQSEGKIILI